VGDGCSSLVCRCGRFGDLGARIISGVNANMSNLDYDRRGESTDSSKCSGNGLSYKNRRDGVGVDWT
jgi:hypothetical protein